jgi:hypothetical protein
MATTMDIKSDDSGASEKSVPQQTQQRILGSYDIKVSLEECMYYAEITRSLEATMKIDPHPIEAFVRQAFRRGPIEPETAIVTAPPIIHEKDTKTAVDDVQTGDAYAVVSQEEWNQASRACRTATWSAVFYLVTTDIMGPYSVP